MRLNRRDLTLAFVLLTVALTLRLHQLDRRVLGHPENYVPGIELPDWVMMPVERNDLQGVMRATAHDGHPPGYFLAMLPWVQAFGNGLVALRLPSSILGALSVLLLLQIALRESDRQAAWLAAVLLAFNGFHIYWSQTARMYVPAGFLCLLSTYLLLRISEDGRTVWQLLYVAATSLALWTQIYCWPLVFGQIVYCALRSIWSERKWTEMPAQLVPAQLVPAQLASVILAAPVVSLAIYQNPGTRWHEPAWQYFQFGNLFGQTGFEPSMAETFAGYVAAVLCLTLVSVSLLSQDAPRPETAASREDEPAQHRVFTPLRLLLLGSLVTVAMLVFAAMAPPKPQYHRLTLYVVAFIPICAACSAGWLPRLLEKTNVHLPAGISLGFAQLSFLLALVPFLCVVLVSAVRAMYVARGTIVFLPFLLLAAAVGIRTAWQNRWLGAVVCALTLGLHIWSIAYWSRAETSPVDYRQFAEEWNSQLLPSDGIVVRHDYRLAPIFYYMPDRLDQFTNAQTAGNQLTDELHDRLETKPARVWVVGFPLDEGHQRLLDAVAGAGYREHIWIESRQADGILFQLDPK